MTLLIHSRCIRHSGRSVYPVKSTRSSYPFRFPTTRVCYVSALLIYHVILKTLSHYHSLTVSIVTYLITSSNFPLFHLCWQSQLLSNVLLIESDQDLFRLMGRVPQGK